MEMDKETVREGKIRVKEIKTESERESEIALFGTEAEISNTVKAATPVSASVPAVGGSRRQKTGGKKRRRIRKGKAFLFL